MKEPMSSRTRYASPVSRPFGTKVLDPDRPGHFFQGEYNQDGLPMGTQRAPAPSLLDNYQAGKATPNLNAFKARQPGAAPATPVGSRTGTPLPVPVGAVGPAGARGVAISGAGQDVHVNPPAPAVAAPAPAPPRWTAPSGGAVPSNPDDRALLMTTRARDAAARAPEAPRPIPAGDPAARAFFGKRSTPEPGAATPAAAPVAQPLPSAPILDAAGTGRPLSTPFGIISSRTASPGETPTAGYATNEGVFHNTPAEQSAANTLATSPFKRAMASVGGPAVSPGGPPAPMTPAMPSRSSMLTGGAPPPGRAVPAGVTPSWTQLAQGGPERTSAGSAPGEETNWSDPASVERRRKRNVDAVMNPTEPGIGATFAEGLRRYPGAIKAGINAFTGAAGGDTSAPPNAFLPKKKATPIMDKVADGYGG